MELFTVFIAIAISLASAFPLEERASSVQGFDISNYQPTVNFQAAYNSGARFVIIKV
jgi:GH25 family lysozyme M1 (1,4-beta-N-acetylmuramidase)